MKTVKKNIVGDIRRVKDTEAYQMVKDGWVYCPKSEWKKLRDANKKVAPKAEADVEQAPEVHRNKYRHGKRKA